MSDVKKKYTFIKLCQEPSAKFKSYNGQHHFTKTKISKLREKSSNCLNLSYKMDKRQSRECIQVLCKPQIPTHVLSLSVMVAKKKKNFVHATL